MLVLREGLAAIQDFLEMGGPVVQIILMVLVLMWTCIFERLWYFRRVYPRDRRRIVQTWNEQLDRTSWYASQIRFLMISRVKMKLRSSLPVIHALVAICPLLGLLGTVTGMIEVFDVMALSGSGNARAMASGVSRATIPTMAGMVAALSGLYFSTSMERFASLESQRLADSLVHR